MVEIVENIIKELVKHPESVAVQYVDRGKNGIFLVNVDDTDVGRVIGKEGKIIKSIDKIITCIDKNKKQNYVLKINEGERNE